MSLLLGGGAYARDKNTSARLCAKNARGRVGVFAGHSGNKTNIALLLWWITDLLLYTRGMQYFTRPAASWNIAFLG